MALYSAQCLIGGHYHSLLIVNAQCHHCRWGRRNTFLACTAMFIGVANLTLISDNYWVNIVFQLLIGAVAYGAYLTVYILCESLILLARIVK